MNKEDYKQVEKNEETIKRGVRNEKYSYLLLPTSYFLINIFLCLSFNGATAQTYYDFWGEPVDDDVVKSKLRDTTYIHDTVYVSDIDGFLKEYGLVNDLKQFVDNFGELKEMMDSLNNLSSYRLYYNFFLPHDSIKQLSSRFCIKEYKVANSNMYKFADNTSEWEELRDKDIIRRELLFHFEDNAEMTDAFLNDKIQIRKTISYMFSAMANSEGIAGINLFFPNYTFKEKRAMVQFVKSIRILMDASQDFKPGKIRLNITFLDKGHHIDKNFSYCLLQEVSEVLYVNSSNIKNNNYTIGERLTLDNIKNISFFPQLKSHFYIARYYPYRFDFRTLDITNFSESYIAKIIEADYPENRWEMYLFILIIFIIAILALIVLYYTYIPFSALINNNIESVLLISIVLILEIVALIVSTFRNMCYTDTFAFMKENPVAIFTLPLIMILVVPFLNVLAKKRRIP